MTSEQAQNVVAEFEDLVPTLARRLVRKFNVSESLKDDLISCGYVALVEAAGRFNPEQSESFRNYLCLRIRGAMIDHLRSSSILSGKSSRFIKALSAIQLMREEDLLGDPVFTDNSKEPVDNLAHILDLAAKGAIAFRLSMDEADNEVTRVDDGQLSAEEKLCLNEDNVALRDLVSKLPEKERLVVEGYYFQDKSFVEIANSSMGMNKSWVSRLHTRALTNLRNMLYEKD